MKKILLLAAITTISLLAANKTFAQYYVRHDRPIIEHRILEPRRPFIPLPPAPPVINPFGYHPGVVVVDRFHRDYRRCRRF